MAKNIEQDKILREQVKAMVMAALEQAGIEYHQSGLQEYAIDVEDRVATLKITLKSQSDDPQMATAAAMGEAYIADRAVIEASKRERTEQAERSRQETLRKKAEKEALDTGEIADDE